MSKVSLLKVVCPQKGGTSFQNQYLCTNAEVTKHIAVVLDWNFDTWHQMKQ